MNDPIEGASVLPKNARMTLSTPQTPSMVIGTPAVLALQALSVHCAKNSAPHPFPLLTWWIELMVVIVVNWRGIRDGRINGWWNIRRLFNRSIIIRQWIDQGWSV
jgi:hypothetical protein